MRKENNVFFYRNTLKNNINTAKKQVFGLLLDFFETINIF